MNEQESVRKNELIERQRARRQQKVRVRAFCKKFLETEEQRAERIKKKRELRALLSSETEEQRAARLQESDEVSKERSLEKEKTKMSDSTRPDRSDTEKVKRRMIRTIGRLLNEKTPEEELWEYMDKEYGKKSRILWDRMRILTLKKLKILLDVDDVVNNVPKVARMSLTDWLIFDLVLVHEKFDVIDMRNVSSNKPSGVLSKLFSLVQQFDIEGRVGEDLANAWITATVHYNAAGHQCSPMLLQRRWYQLKEVTRDAFYKFWFIFHGSKRQLAKAKEESPVSELQRDVALRYSHIITEPFKQWEECIKDRTVIMPEEFEMKMRSANLMSPNDLTVPDLVLLEPKLNTIDLCDSDEEVTSNQEKQTDDHSEPKTTETNVTIKSEPIDLDDNVDDETEVPIETQSDSNFDDEIQRLQLVSNEISIGSDDEVQHVDERDSDAHLNDDEDMALQKAVESLNCLENNTGGETNETNLETPDLVEKNPTTDATSSQDINSRTDDNDNECSTNENTDNHPSMQTDTNTNEDIDHTLENFSPTELVVKLEKDAIITDSTEEVLPVISTVTSAGVPVDLGDAVEGEPLKPENSVNTVDISNKNIDQRMVIQIKQQNQITHLDDDITEVVNPQSIIPHHSKLLLQIDDHGTENKKVQASNIDHLARNIVDDQIENSEQISDDNQTEKREVVETHNKEDSSSEEDIISLMSHNRDDIIKLESPTVKKLDEFDVPMDLDFADDGIQLVDDGIEYVESDNEQNLESEEEEPRIDLKLLMCPAVYTTKIDNMTIFKNTPVTEQIRDKAVIDRIAFLSKPVSKLAVLAEIEIQKQEAKEKSQKVQILPATDESLEVSMTDIKHQELIMKCEPKETALNEEITTSDDEELPRINSTSYLLRKPNNRSYNPIQLCKNPDFNTRLKRIPVSFYTYPRNRILLNECKPITIDVSKAFESKLYNGTLYLTQTRIDPCGTPLHKACDDATSSSIVPSAPPVPCLMDVDKILEEELKKRVVERNRAINLPDITEVRRINQQLLTAEVMPLKKSLENETTDIAVDNSVVSDNTSVGGNSIVCNSPVALASPTASDIPTISENSAVVDNAYIINDDQTPEPEIETQCDKNTEIVDEDTVTPIPYLEPIIPQKKSATKPPVKTNIDEHYNVNTNTNYISLNQARKQYRKNVHPQPNWLKKPNYQVDNSDVLLTTDTLYKMLFALDPEAGKITSFNKYVNETLKNKVAKQPICKNKMKTSKEDDSTQEIQTKQQDNKSQSNPEPQPSNLKAKVNVVYDSSKCVKRGKKNCCWARHRIEYLTGAVKRGRKHWPCGEICMCCCAMALANLLAIQNEKVKNQKIMEQEKSQEEEKLKKACESIESVVQQSKPLKEAGVYTLNTARVEPVQTLAPLVPDSTDKNAPIYLETRDNQDNVIVPELPIPIHYEKPQPSILQKMLDARSQTTDLQNNTPINKHIPHKCLQWTTCPCKRPILTQSNRRTIVVDGTISGAFYNKNKELEASKKEKLYVNRKSSFDRPIFIGKNKLLLTNFKQPAQKQPLLERPPFLSAVPAGNDIQLPQGVQIVLLPNGTLTYTVDLNSQLTETQLAIMPAILAAIQQQIDCGNLSMVPTATVVGDIGQNDIIGFQGAPNNTQNTPVEPSLVETIDLDDNELNDSTPIVSQGPGIDVLKNATNDSSPNDDKPSDAMSTMQLPSSKAQDNIVSGEMAQIEEVMEVDNMQASQSTDNKQTPNETSEGLEPKNTPENEINKATVKNTEDKPSEDKPNSQVDKKSLLSDLMEMSGICEEDVAPAPVSTPIPMDPEQHLTKTRVFATKPKVRAIAPKASSETCKDIYADLSTVNSFAELKIAYENNGLFFKLDLDTGVIIPITLCLKKKGTAALSIPKSIIDLTDDNDIDDDENVTFNTNTTDAPLNIKTTHVFKRVFDEVKGSPSIRKDLSASTIKHNHRPNILRNTSNKTKVESRSLLKYYIIPEKNTSKSIEIDSGDSDTPMVEEYLDSTSDDESDDEPLAKMAKRAAVNRQTSAHIENKLSSLDSTVNIEREGQFALESTINEEFMLSESVQQAEMQPGVPKPTHLVLTRDAVHETVPIDTFFQNEGDDSDEEDCILGV